MATTAGEKESEKSEKDNGKDNKNSNWKEPDGTLDFLDFGTAKSDNRKTQVIRTKS